MVISLNGQVAIVTGAARGIGAGIARALAAAGTRVAVVDVAPPDQARDTVDAIQAVGPEALYIQVDVSDEAAVRRMVDQVLDTLGRIDILVNNAGVLSQSPLVDLPTEEWDRVMAVNLRSMFLCCRAVLPHMLRRGSGRIINIASQLAYLGGVEMAHYSASKGGVVSFTRSLAREVAAQGILVNGIAPGPIETDLLVDATEEWKAWKPTTLPIGRFGRVDEVAPTAVFLASDAASYYVGQILGPNGGDVMP